MTYANQENYKRGPFAPVPDMGESMPIPRMPGGMIPAGDRVRMPPPGDPNVAPWQGPGPIQHMGQVGQGQNMIGEQAQGAGFGQPAPWMNASGLQPRSALSALLGPSMQTAGYQRQSPLASLFGRFPQGSIGAMAGGRLGQHQGLPSGRRGYLPSPFQGQYPGF